jgi:hypothetical protein
LAQAVQGKQAADLELLVQIVFFQQLLAQAAAVAQVAVAQ